MQICDLRFKPTAQDPIEYNSDLRSVAISDFNNDTWLDMVVVNNIANNIVIYLWADDGTFSRPIKYSTGSDSAPYMVAVGDLNNDARVDIAVANFGTHNIGIFFGFGNGSFANQIEFSTAAFRPIAICLADFNNDTLLDIVTANYGDHSISMLHGYGNSSFSNPFTYPMGYDSFPYSLVAGDFNNDNHLDIAVANYGTNNVVVLFGNTKGSFGNPATFSTGSGSHPSSITVGHFNEDNFLDIAVAHTGTNKIGVFLTNKNRSFTKQTMYSLNTTSTYAIGVGDLNQDNRVDLIVTNKGVNNIGVLLGSTNGTFILSKMYSTGSTSSVSLAIRDFNKDNRLDLIIISNDTNGIDLMLGFFEGFSNQINYFTYLGGQYVAVGDFQQRYWTRYRCH